MIIVILLLIYYFISYILKCTKIHENMINKNLTEFTVISNTCVGYMVMQKFNIKYNNPFIGSLIIDDDDYIKLVNNFIEYINYKPVLYIPNNEKNNKYTQQTNSKYYIHDAINVPYPIFLLKDIEIHYVHENNNEIALNKFNKRIERLKKMINNNHKIFITMSFSQFINKHDNYELLIDKFLEKSNNKNIIKIFIGPKEFYKEKYGVNYMILFEWNNFNFERNKSNIFMSNDENLCVEKIKQLIEKFI